MFIEKIMRGKSFLFYTEKKGDSVVLTGHVGPNESLKQAVKREIKEELGVKPKKIIDLAISTTVEIKEDDAVSTEHAFLIEIPDKNIRFLEGDEEHKWHPLEELSKVLTYSNQKEPLRKIKEILK